MPTADSGRCVRSAALRDGDATERNRPPGTGPGTGRTAGVLATDRDAARTGVRAPTGAVHQAGAESARADTIFVRPPGRDGRALDAAPERAFTPTSHR